MKNNLETVSMIYEAFGNGDILAILDCMDENVQWESWSNNSAQKANVPWMRPQQGKQGVLLFFQTLGAKLDIKDFQVRSLMAGGNQVAAEFMIEFENKDTGLKLRDEEMHLWTFNEEGKVTRLRHYLDTFKHMQVANELHLVN